jgi:hypothetical protein
MRARARRRRGRARARRRRRLVTQSWRRRARARVPFGRPSKARRVAEPPSGGGWATVVRRGRRARAVRARVCGAASARHWRARAQRGRRPRGRTRARRGADGGAVLGLTARTRKAAARRRRVAVATRKAPARLPRERLKSAPRRLRWRRRPRRRQAAGRMLRPRATSRQARLSPRWRWHAEEGGRWRRRARRRRARAAPARAARRRVQWRRPRPWRRRWRRRRGRNRHGSYGPASPRCDAYCREAPCAASRCQPASRFTPFTLRGLSSVFSTGAAFPRTDALGLGLWTWSPKSKDALCERVNAATTRPQCRPVCRPCSGVQPMIRFTPDSLIRGHAAHDSSSFRPEWIRVVQAMTRFLWFVSCRSWWATGWTRTRRRT